MDEAALYEWLANAEAQNPGALQKMIDAGLFDDRTAIERQTLGIGKQMFDTPMAQGQHVGGTYVAASPIEHLSNALRQGVGAWLMGGSQQNQRDLVNQKGGGMEALIRAMARQQQQPQPMPTDPNAAPPWNPYAMPRGDGSI